MRGMWLAGLMGCLAVQGCVPPPDAYYGAPPGYAPQPYAATPGGVSQQALPPPDQAADPGYAPPTYAPSAYALPPDVQPGYAEPAYGQPGYAEPAFIQPGYLPPAYYRRPVPAYGYAPPPTGFYGGPRFDRDRAFDRGRFDREHFEQGRAGRERFERSRFQDRMPQDRPRPSPQPQPQPRPQQALQGPARSQDFRRPPDGQGRPGLTPDQLRQLR